MDNELQERTRHDITLGPTTYVFWISRDDGLWFWESTDVESTEGGFTTESAALADAESVIRTHHEG